MVVEMCKMGLVGMTDDRSALLDAIERTKAVQIIRTEAQPSPRTDDLTASRTRVEGAIALLSDAVGAYNADHKIKSDELKDDFDVTYGDFIAVAEQQAEWEAVCQTLYDVREKTTELTSLIAKQKRLCQQAAVFAGVKERFSSFAPTKHTQIKLGTVPAMQYDSLRLKVEETDLCGVEELSSDGMIAVVLAVCHNDVAKEFTACLNGCSFSPCPFTSDETGAEQYERLCREAEESEVKLRDLQSSVVVYRDKLKSLKTYSDYLSLQIEKSQVGDEATCTHSTFSIEAYVPVPQKEKVEEAIRKTTPCCYLEFSDIPEDENPPTLLKNNAVVSNFEGITNMYSPTNYRELDPNAIMSFFYSIFLGFIMADVGYGLMMLLGGGLLWYKTRKRPTGTTSLAFVFAVGGIFAVIWGFLFNSAFGIKILPVTLLPDAQKAMWSFMGIKIPSILIVAMLLGIGQLFAGYVCRAVQEFRRGNPFDGIFAGIDWAIFSVGVALAIVGLVDDFGLPVLATVGGITAGVTLVIAMISSGHKGKGFGKLIKAFGQAYGIINYASDILSYARLYGLMLSGAVIAQIVSTYSLQFIGNGGVGIVFGVLLMIVGHVFNLAISLLGAYIHDARLQYVEFYSRFYEGEGEIFTPFGSHKDYIRLA